MVMIEPETKQTYKRESREIRQEVPVRREGAAATETKEVTVNLDFLQKISEGFNNLIDFFKAKLAGKDIATAGLSPQKRSEYYIKKCWNYMALNKVDEARKAYDNLVASYESMEEGPAKTNLYYEVYDIYQRLAEVN